MAFIDNFKWKQYKSEVERLQAATQSRSSNSRSPISVLRLQTGIMP